MHVPLDLPAGVLLLVFRRCGTQRDLVVLLVLKGDTHQLSCQLIDLSPY